MITGKAQARRVSRRRRFCCGCGGQSWPNPAGRQSDSAHRSKGGAADADPAAAYALAASCADRWVIAPLRWMPREFPSSIPTSQLPAFDSRPIDQALPSGALIGFKGRPGRPQVPVAMLFLEAVRLGVSRPGANNGPLLSPTNGRAFQRDVTSRGAETARGVGTACVSGYCAGLTAPGTLLHLFHGPPRRLAFPTPRRTSRRPAPIAFPVSSMPRASATASGLCVHFSLFSPAARNGSDRRRPRFYPTGALLMSTVGTPFVPGPSSKVREQRRLQCRDTRRTPALCGRTPGVSACAGGVAAGTRGGARS